MLQMPMLIMMGIHLYRHFWQLGNFSTSLSYEQSSVGNDAVIDVVVPTGFPRTFFLIIAAHYDRVCSHFSQKLLLATFFVLFCSEFPQ